MHISLEKLRDAAAKLSHGLVDTALSCHFGGRGFDTSEDLWESQRSVFLVIEMLSRRYKAEKSSIKKEIMRLLMKCRCKGYTSPYHHYLYLLPESKNKTE